MFDHLNQTHFQDRLCPVLCTLAKWSIRPELIPVSVATHEATRSNSTPLGVILLPLDGMLVHRRVTPGIKFIVTRYTPEWRDAL